MAAKPRVTGWKRRVLVIVRVPLLAVVGYFALIFLAQRALAFPGTFRDSPRATATVPDDVRQVWLDASFGRVEAWLYTAADVGAAPTVVFAHGNGELIEEWEPEMRALADAGVNALAVEFPGYGHSEGRPTRTTIAETFTLAYDWLEDLSVVDPARIIAYGRSMGGGAAADLALARPARALVLQSTFSSAMAMARLSFAPGFLVRDRFDNVRAVEQFGGAVLLMHGPRDDVIPYSQAEELAAVRAGLQIVDLDCGHNDCARVWPMVIETFVDFLRTHEILD